MSPNRARRRGEPNNPSHYSRCRGANGGARRLAAEWQARGTSWLGRQAGGAATCRLCSMPGWGAAMAAGCPLVCLGHCTTGSTCRQGCQSGQPAGQRARGCKTSAPHSSGTSDRARGGDAAPRRGRNRCELASSAPKLATYRACCGVWRGGPSHRCAAGEDGVNPRRSACSAVRHARPAAATARSGAARLCGAQSSLRWRQQGGAASTRMGRRERRRLAQAVRHGSERRLSAAAESREPAPVSPPTPLVRRVLLQVVELLAREFTFNKKTKKV